MLADSRVTAQGLGYGWGRVYLTRSPQGPVVGRVSVHGDWVHVEPTDNVTMPMSFPAHSVGWITWLGDDDA